MRRQQAIETGDLLISGRIEWEPEVDHTSVRLSLSKDQVTEVTIVGDQDSALGDGDGQDFVVWQSGWVVLADSGRVISTADEKRSDSRLGTLIQQEPHRAA